MMAQGGVVVCEQSPRSPIRLPPSTPDSKASVVLTPATSDGVPSVNGVEACDTPLKSIEGDRPSPSSIFGVSYHEPPRSLFSFTPDAPLITCTPPPATKSAHQAVPARKSGSRARSLSPSFRNALTNSSLCDWADPFNLNAVEAALTAGQSVEKSTSVTSVASVQEPNTPSSNASPNPGPSPPASPTPSVTPLASPAVVAREHLSPTPTPASSHRRRRSSSAIPLARHEVSDEEPPATRFDRPEFQKAFSDTKSLMAALSDVLASGSLHQDQDSAMKKLYDDVTRLSTFQCPETRTVGFVGESGAGKSSLINSLLDVEDLAWANGGGKACTCVVTEYAYHDSPAFDIEVHYFNREHHETQLEKLLKSYRQYHSGQEVSGYELEYCRERAQLARDTFHSMFGPRLEECDDFLLKWAERDALNKLMSWVDDIQPQSTVKRETVDDVKTCSRRLMELTSEVTSNDGPSMWPYIDRIRVRLNAHILSKGLILVDLPGLRDVNAARRKITERYIRNCDEIFAVCGIIRAITDEGVKAVIELAVKASLSKVGIVCTKSDVINLDEADKGYKGEVADSMTTARLAVDKDERKLLRIQGEILELEGLEDLDDKEKDELLLLQRSGREAERKLEQSQFERERLHVTTRNQLVRDDLQTAYRDKIPGQQLAVFCVGKTYYWKYRNHPKDQSADGLDLSGVIQLRRHCMAIVSESQFQAATRYMETEVPAALDLVQLWVQSGSGSASAERKQATLDSLAKVDKSLRTALDRPESIINRRTMLRLYRDHILQNQQTDEWVQGATKAARVWHQWNHGTYAAFCRKYGTYFLGSVGNHNWNEQAMTLMVSSLQPKWKALCKEFASRSRDAITSTEDILDDLATVLEPNGELDEEEFDTLTSAVGKQWDLFEQDLCDLLDETSKELRKLEIDAYSAIRTSYIGEAMENAYEACNMESGRGSDLRRKTIIEERLGSEDIFEEMQERLTTRFKLITDDLEKRLASIRAQRWQAVQGTLDMLRDENVILESESDPAFRKRVDDRVQETKAALHATILTAGLS